MPCAGPLVTGPVRVTASDGSRRPAGWLADALRRRGVTVIDQRRPTVHLVGYGDGAGPTSSAGAAVTVAMDTPYVLAAADSPVLLATYSSTEAALRAAAAVIAGRARGDRPVAGRGGRTSPDGLRRLTVVRPGGHGRLR